MLLLGRVLCLLVVLANVLAYDSSFVRLIDDAITVLFPPVRVSAYLCHLDQGERSFVSRFYTRRQKVKGRRSVDETIRLSRLMSRSGLAHEIHAEGLEGLEGLEARTGRDFWDHRVLYVLDLDCDYAVPLLRAVRPFGNNNATCLLKYSAIHVSRYVS